MARGLLVAALAACGGNPPTTTAQTPPFAVGVTTRKLVDMSRATPQNGGQPGMSSRNLPTEIWYPIAGSDPGETRDAPPLARTAPWPLLLFVHGSDGNRRQSTFLTDGLAAAGYVVAAADFPLTASSTPGGSSDLHVDDQLGDLRFLQRTLTMPSAALSPLPTIEAKRYAVIGHSTGGTVALLAAFAPDTHDDQLAAAVALAPCACFFGDAFFTTRSVPLLVAAGTDDLFVPPADNGVRAFTLAPPPRLLATLVGGTHLYFTDYPIPDATLHPMPTTSDADLAVTLARYGGGACSPIPPPGMDPGLTSDEQQALTVPLVVAFLEAQLGANGKPLADLEASPPAHLLLRDH